MITLGDISWDMILGGFALFLFGIKFMGDGLKNVAGHKLREYIDKYTSNPLMAVLVGIVVTIVVQSSSAATAITIASENEMIVSGTVTVSPGIRIFGKESINSFSRRSPDILSSPY